jgi:thiol-disulfide isomerase/thioredoxin
MTRNGICKTGSHAFGIVVFLALAGVERSNAFGSNDNFANATPLFGITNFTTSNFSATAEPGEPRHAGEAPESTLWWKWTVPFTATFSVVTTNSIVTTNVQLDTVAAVYSGSSLSNLTLVVANDDTAYGDYGATWSRCVFRAYAGETLMIAVGSLGATGIIRFSVDVAGPYLLPLRADGLNGDPLLSTSFSGQVLLIDFWETICGGCIEELPQLIQLQTNLAPRGFTVIGLVGDEHVADVVTYVANTGINYPIAMGNSALQTSVMGRFLGYPTKVLVDQEGRMVGIYLGINTEKGYRAIIEPLLRPNPMVHVGITRAGGTVKIHWPSSETGYTVERTAQLAGGTWFNLATAPVVTNGENVVTEPAGPSAQFFRLKKP